MRVPRETIAPRPPTDQKARGSNPFRRARSKHETSPPDTPGGFSQCTQSALLVLVGADGAQFELPEAMVDVLRQVCHRVGVTWRR